MILLKRFLSVRDGSQYRNRWEQSQRRSLRSGLRSGLPTLSGLRILRLVLLLLPVTAVLSATATLPFEAGLSSGAVRPPTAVLSSVLSSDALSSVFTSGNTLPGVDPAGAGSGDSTGSGSRGTREQALESFLLGTLRQSQGQYTEALAEFRRSIENDSTQAEVHLEMARTYVIVGKPDSALASARAAGRFGSEEADVFSIEGRSLINLGRPNDALEPLLRAHAMDPDNPSTVMNVLTLLYNQGKYEQALELISPSLRPSLELPGILQRRAVLLLRVGRKDEAARDLASVLRREPQFRDTETMLHRLAEEMGNPASLAPVFEEILEDQPSLERVRMHLCRILMTSDRWKDAEPHLEMLLRAHPEDAQIEMQLGMLLYRDERIAEALPHFQRAARQAPDEPEILRWLWRGVMLAGQPEEGLKTADALLASVPEDLEARTFRALSLKGLKREDEALALAESVFVKDPGRRDAGLLTALIYNERGNPRLASSRLREVLERYPDDREVRFQLGVSLEQSGDVDSALAEFDRLLLDVPDDPRALNYAGYMCIDRGIRLDQAMDRVRRAVELAPETSAFLDSYGWGFYRTGNSDRALEFLERAATLSPEEITILKHLGEVQEASGQRDQARATFQKALRLAPDDPEVRDWIQRLEKDSNSPEKQPPAR